jgi:hypothetical protein
MRTDELRRLAELISHIDYVVQRNWDFPPEHDDIDLFTSNEEKQELIYLTRDFPIKVDVRSPEDLYYPDEVNDLMLVGKREANGFKIPSAKASFLALYYHNLVHKKDNPYGDKLGEMFLEWMPPVKCTDNGVGYYVNS